MPCYKIIISCNKVPIEYGQEAAIDITNEFLERPWHKSAACVWDGGQLILTVENNFDQSGTATSDEFADALSAYLPPFDGDLCILQIQTI